MKDTIKRPPYYFSDLEMIEDGASVIVSQEKENKSIICKCKCIEKIVRWLRKVFSSTKKLM